jgi:hypothetical protein
MESTKLHQPQRQPDEAQYDYRVRQAASRHVAQLGRDVETGQRVLLKGLGDQHKAPSSRASHRDQLRANGRGPKGTFGASLVAAWAKKRRDSKAHLAKHPRDAHGAVTFVGPKYELDGFKPLPREFELSGGVHDDGTTFHTVRRIWLGGISAQRGY